MDWWQWVLVGLTFWALMLTLICVLNYRFWNHCRPLEPEFPMRCTGCQRHHVRADCPVHGCRA